MPISRCPLPDSMNLISQNTIRKNFFRKESVLHKVAPYQFVNIYFRTIKIAAFGSLNMPKHIPFHSLCFFKGLY